MLRRIIEKATGVLICAFFVWHSDPVFARHGAPASVLIIGNSIAHHKPAPELGWQGDWGMAASVADSDFVHQLSRLIHANGSPYAVVQTLNIAGFERDYDHFSLEGFDSLRNPDLIIVKLGENVDDYNALQRNFSTYFKRMLDYFDPAHHAQRIVVSPFWKAPQVVRVLRNYALFYHYPFVDIQGLSEHPAYIAAAAFTNPMVGAHPSDAGMRMIAEAIWLRIKNYF